MSQGSLCTPEQCIDMAAAHPVAIEDHVPDRLIERRRALREHARLETLLGEYEHIFERLWADEPVGIIGVALVPDTGDTHWQLEWCEAIWPRLFEHQIVFARLNTH